MNAPTGRLRADPLAALLPQCTDPREQELRRWLMDARDAATATLAQYEPGRHASQLCLMVVETAASWIFAPASIKHLEAVKAQCVRLMKACYAVQAIEGGWI